MELLEQERNTLSWVSERPPLQALEDDVALFEWPSKMEMSIPADFRVSLNYYVFKNVTTPRPLFSIYSLVLEVNLAST